MCNVQLGPSCIRHDELCSLFWDMSIDTWSIQLLGGVVRQEQLLYSKAIQSNVLIAMANQYLQLKVLISYCILNLLSVGVGVLQPKSTPFKRDDSPVTLSLGCTTHFFLYSTILYLKHCYYSSVTASNKQWYVTFSLKTFTSILDSSDTNRQNKVLFINEQHNVLYCKLCFSCKNNKLVPTY